MEPKERYVCKDFKRFARKDFPGQFSIFKDVFTSNFEHKTYLDMNNGAHSANVLAVGNYHRRQGEPPVFAQATTTGIRYFYGKADESVVTQIPEENVTRIYYAAPYSSMVGSQGGGGRTAGWKAGHHIVETIINVLFLLAGQVEHISNPARTDMLSTFKYVCSNSASKSETQNVDAAATLRQSELPTSDVQRDTKKRKRSSSIHRQRIKQEVIDEDDIAFVGDLSQFHNQSTSHSPMPYRPASSIPPTFPLDHTPSSESGTLTELEREKRARHHEVQTLRAKLLQQELKIQAAEENAMRETKQRKQAEEQVENLQGQIAALKQSERVEDIEVVMSKTSERMKRQRAEITKLGYAIEARNRTIRDLKDQLANMSKAYPRFN